VEFRGESYSHLMEHGWSIGGRSALLRKYMDFGVSNLNNNSVYDY
jgi:hypothetical protein